MGAMREEFPVEKEAAERDATRDRATDEAAHPPEFKYDFGCPGYGVLMARETPALSWGLDTVGGDVSPVLVERDLNSLKHVFCTLGEQRREIARLREDTRQVLAGLSPA